MLKPHLATYSMHYLFHSEESGNKNYNIYKQLKLNNNTSLWYISSIFFFPFASYQQYWTSKSNSTASINHFTPRLLMIYNSIQSEWTFWSSWFKWNICYKWNGIKNRKVLNISWDDYDDEPFLGSFQRVDNKLSFANVCVFRKCM